jgi:hypothetical protein
LHQLHLYPLSRASTDSVCVIVANLTASPTERSLLHGETSLAKVVDHTNMAQFQKTLHVLVSNCGRFIEYDPSGTYLLRFPF